VERGNERNATLERDHATRQPIVGVDNVKMLLRDNSPHLACGPGVVERPTAAVEIEQAQIDTEVLKVLDLIAHERSEPWLLRSGEHVRDDENSKRVMRAWPVALSGLNHACGLSFFVPLLLLARSSTRRPRSPLGDSPERRRARGNIHTQAAAGSPGEAARKRSLTGSAKARLLRAAHDHRQEHQDPEDQER
jgi:hypothetical protein